MPEKILVTGATGNIGSILVPQLAGTPGSEVAALVRDTDRAQALAEAGANLVTGTFDDGETLRAAMRDIETVVLIAPPGPDCVRQNRNVMDAAQQAGVKKIVRISAIKAAADGRTENTRLHGKCDQMLQASGMAYVILRPNYFMQNLFLSLDAINSRNAVIAAMGDGKLSMIDVRDVAAAAAVAATSDRFDGEVLELSGPESIGFAEIASILSELAGRQIAYVPISAEELAESLLEFGFDDWMAELLREYSLAYASGWGDLVTDSVESMTGRAPHSFRAFANDVLAPSLGQDSPN